LEIKIQAFLKPKTKCTSIRKIIFYDTKLEIKIQAFLKPKTEAV
jgi:hypothetical protein